MKQKRVVQATALLFAAGSVLIASPASAAEETVGSCMVEVIEELGGAEAVDEIVEAGHSDGASKEAKEELEKMEEEFEGCLEAPNPILPETNEIIWGGLAFFVLLGLMIKFGFPAVKGAMEARTERIRSDLDEAEQARVEAVEIKDQHAAELADAKAEAGRIIDEARQEAGVVKADLQRRAEEDIVELRQRADADVAAARDRAIADLQAEVSDIVVGAAGRVVEQNLDVDTQRQLIDNYIANIGSR